MRAQVLFFALCLLIGTDAAAGKGQKAQALLETSAKAIADKRFDAAYAALTAAYKEKEPPSAEALYQLGQLAVAEQRMAAAQDLMRRYLAEPAIVAQKSSPAIEEARRVMALPIELAGEVALFGARGALIYLDEKLVGALPLPLPLLCAVGTHRVALEQGKKRLQGKVLVRAGHLAEMRFSGETGSVLVTRLPAVLLVQAGGASAEAARFQQAALQVLQAKNFVAFRTQVALTKAQKPESCLEDTACLAEVSDKSEVSYALVLRARSQAAAGAASAAEAAQWELGVSFIDPKIGEVGAQASQSCARCTLDQAAEALAELTRRVSAQGPLRPRGTLIVRSNPPGAEVREGERLLGTTPYQRAAYAGEHKLSLSRQGYERLDAAVTVIAGQPATLEPSLQEIAEPAPAPLIAPPEPPKKPRIVAEHRTRIVKLARPRWRIGLGISAVVLGVGLGALGFSAAAQDGRCVAAPTQEGGACREVFNTRGAAIGLIVPALALTAGGVILLALPGGTRTVDEVVYKTVPDGATAQ